MDQIYTGEDITEGARRLDVAFSALNAAIAHDVGVSVPEFLALANIGTEGALGPSDLACRLQLSTGAVTALVDRLEARGHARRSAHPHDRRRVVVTRTDEVSRQIATEVEPLRREVRALAEGLSEHDRMVVGRFLDDLTTVISRTASRACGS